MKNYGQWQRDALEAITAVLSGSLPDASEWTVSGPPTAAGEFTRRDSDGLRLLPFGDVKSEDYPFFRAPIDVRDLVDLHGKFPIDGSAFKEAKTNKTLAEAVAVGLASANEHALVVMVSDFLVDAGMTSAQIAFLNDAQSRYAVHVLNTFSWKSSPNVQIKLIKYIPHDARPTPSAESPAHTAPPVLRAQAAFHKPSESVRLSWTLDGAKAVKYSVSIREASGTTVVFSKDNLALRNAVWPNPDGGAYTWSVTAHLDNGAQAVQRGAVSVPGGSGSGKVLLGFLLLVGLGAGLWWLDRSGMLPKGWRRRPKDEQMRT